jgi:hypothetical protein
MKNKSASSSIALLGAATACSILTGTLLAFSHPQAPSRASQRTLTFEERVAYQRAIEEVYWRHRTWPKKRTDPKPSPDAVMSQAQLEKKVVDYLRNSQALADYWHRPITTQQLQAEMNRMAKHTKQPEVLQELFEALGNDPFVIAECLARPVLVGRVFQAAHHLRDVSSEVDQLTSSNETDASRFTGYTLPVVATTSNVEGVCVDGTWNPVNLASAPIARESHTAVWTGSEMIIWGGVDSNLNQLNTGGRYNPITDTWTATNTTNAPAARNSHSAVWTGTEMIVWGGADHNFTRLNTGGRYDPGTDSWTATSNTNAPAGRNAHTAVWTGTEMIVWGGEGDGGPTVNTGGKYNPATNSWTATSTVNAPDARYEHTAVWTGTEMVVWGGYTGSSSNTGGRYDPGNNTWAATSITNAPDARYAHTAVWTDSEMIVWGDSIATALE